MNIVIREGKNYSNRILPMIRCKTISGTVKLKGDFSYKINKSDQLDTNKLIGLSDSINHHIDSIRFGWRWNDNVNKLELLYTLYRDGKRYIEPISYIETDKEYDFEVAVDVDKYLLWFDGKYIEVFRSSQWFLPRYVLFPYFGGDEVAPKDFEFEFNFK